MAIFCRCIPHCIRCQISTLSKYPSSSKLWCFSPSVLKGCPAWPWHTCEHHRMSGWAKEVSPKVTSIYIYIHDNAICNYICNNMPSFVIPVPQLQSQTLSSCNTLFIAPGLKFWLRCGTFQRGPLLVAGGGIVDKVLGQVGVGWIPKSSAIMCNNGWTPMRHGRDSKLGAPHIPWKWFTLVGNEWILL